MKMSLGILIFTAVTLAASLGQANEQGVTDAKILIGSSMRLSGPGKENNVAMKLGQEVYWSKVNETGGVHGRKIELLIYDHGSLPKNTVDNVKRLVETDKVFALLSVVGTPNAKAALPMITRTGIPFVGPIIGTEEFINPVIPNVFVVRKIFPDEAEALVKTLVDKLKVENIAMFRDSSGLGTGGKAAVERSLHKRGKKLSKDVSFMPGDGDLSQEFKALFESKPQAVILWAQGDPLAKFLKLAHGADWQPRLGIASPGVNPEVIAALKAAGVKEAFFSLNVPYVTETNFEIVKQFNEDMKKAGHVSDPKAFETYLNAAVLHEALTRAGRDLTRGKLFKAMESMNDVSIGGLKLNFSPTDHQGLNHVYMVQLKDGELVSYTP